MSVCVILKHGKIPQNHWGVTMKEYEVATEYINPCGGSEYAIRNIFEIETDDPVQSVRQEGRVPIMEVTTDKNGDLLVITGDGKGYFIRYTFSE